MRKVLNGVGKGEVLLWLGLGAWSLTLAIRLRDYWFDDPAITYRYAQNIATGAGFVYQRGEQVLGTTTPLYTLLLSGLYSLSDRLPQVSVAVSALALFGSGVLIYLLCGRHYLGAVAATMVVTDLLLIQSVGLEVPVYGFLALLSLALFEKGCLGWTGAVAGLVTLTRPDGVVLAGVMGLASLVRNRRFPFSMAACCLLVLLPWIVFATAFFGSPLPNTFAAKAQTGPPTEFIAGLGRILHQYVASNPLYLVVAIALAFSSRMRKNLVPWAWVLVSLLGYVFVSPFLQFWYFSALVPILGVLVGRGLVEMTNWLSGVLARDDKYRSKIVSASLAFVCLPLPLKAGWDSLHIQTPPHNITYEDVGAWMRANVPDDALVMAADVGIVGYVSGKRMLDTFALVSPQMLTHEGDALYAISRYLPDYVLVKRCCGGWREALEDSDWFRAIYSPAAQFTTPGDRLSPQIIYSLELPPRVASGKVKASFGESLYLEEWELFVDESVVVAKLSWQGLEARSDTTVFLHVRDSVHDLVAQNDSVPFLGSYPVPQWRRGEEVVEYRFVVLPPNAPTELRLIVGAYDSQTGQQLSVYSHGQEVGTEVELTTVALERRTEA